MDKINTVMERLLQGKQVQWKALGDITNYEQPSKYIVNSREFFDTPTDGCSTPVLTAGKTFILGYTNENEGIYRASEEPVIIFDDFTTDTRWIDFDFKIRSSTLKMITAVDEEIALQKFIFYWLETQSSPEKGSNRRQWISNYAKKKIPIPPLHVQEEIVRILDTLTELTKELTKEQEARQTQYEYYRDKLLTFEEGEVEWVELQKIARLRNGKDWKSLSEGDIPVYGSGGVMAYVDSYAYNKPTVLIPRKGTLTNIFYVEQPFWNVDTIFYTEIDIEQINPKYFYYFIKSLDLMSLNTGTGRPSLTQSILNKLKVPIPPLHVQEEIVNKLDRFSALANSITEGLPREIELRQQQYEYYRDLLLSFPKAA